LINSTEIMSALQSHAAQTGYFTSVNGHEPKSAHVRDAVNLSFWAGPIRPILSSGLASVSYRWEVIGRIFMNASAEPADGIDPALVDATFSLLSSLAADFTLDSVLTAQKTRCIDVYGSDGEPMSATPGYYDYGTDTMRCMDIVIPLLINDVTDLGA
jgi:hypothetical protein